MLTIPDLGWQVEVSYCLTQWPRMSVEQHTVSGKGESVNSFLSGLRFFTG